VIFVVFYAATFSFLIMYTQTATRIGLISESAAGNFQVSDLLYITLLLFLIVAAFQIGVLALIRVMGILYNLRSFTSVHIYEHIRVNQIFCSLMLIVFLLLNAAFDGISRPLLANVIITLLLLQALLVCIRINKVITFKKVYLISYFCITEFIPVLISIKFFVRP
jgi:hypothetical protein